MNEYGTERAADFDPGELIDRVMGDARLARKITGRFLEDMPRQLLALSEALSNADAIASRRVAHSIKGAAANMSVTPVRNLAERLEDLGHEGRLAEASELLPVLSATFDAVTPAMRQFSEG